MNDISVSKIVGTPTETSWSQASSTGKLYIVLSLSSESETEGIIAKGKNVLEQIQREFFAIDNKNLSEIKNVAQKVFSSLEGKTDYSAVIGAIKDNILYIVTASTGTVLIERNNSLAEIARGEKGEIIGFSGKLENDDVIILETGEFNRKISNKLLAEYTGKRDVEKIAEDLAPFILDSSNGEEAAIVINFTDKTIENKPIIPQQQSAEPNYVSNEYEDLKREENVGEKSFAKPKLINPFTFITSKLQGMPQKQKGIIVFAVLIALLLVGSLFAEGYMEERRVVVKEFTAIFDDASEKLESAKSLSSLNKGRALEEINTAIERIEVNLSRFKEGSNEYKELSLLLEELKDFRDELGGGSQITGNIIFSTSDAEILENIKNISYSEDRLVIVGDNGYAILDESGRLDKEEETSNRNIKKITTDGTYLYLLGNNVTRINLSNGNNTNIISDTDSFLDISHFGSNIYLLEDGGDYVSRYSGSSYQKASYFSNSPSISGKATSFAIDASIYILSDNSTIRKFTRGTADSNFELESGVEISKNALLYGNEELSNIYILDIDNASIVVIKPNGEIDKQFNSLELQNAKSFTVNSSESKVFVVIDDQVYSYDL